MSEYYILTLQGPNGSGIVAAVTTALAKNGGDILASAQFDDRETGRFFMRIEFEIIDTLEPLAMALAAVSAEKSLRHTLRLASRRTKVLMLVSKFDHCLGDLLYRTRTGELPIDCVGIVGNHPASVLNVRLVDGIPYHHLPVIAETKQQQEQQIRDIATQTGAELVILARYMQILSKEMSAWLSGRCINIHHSFLPGFKGAKPYHQAHERGVKMIGATAHYVTEYLDEGPIIAQDVELVTHADNAEDMVRKGRDIERRVLARAVACHLEDRVFINGHKTVVFP